MAVQERVGFWRNRPELKDEGWEKLRGALVRAEADSTPTSTSKDFLLPNLQVGDFFPQQDILSSPKLTAFISHGGGNSVTEALERGVPLLLIPHANNPDAPLSRDRAVEEGVGLDLVPILATYPPRSRCWSFRCGEGFYGSPPGGAGGGETWESAISRLNANWARVVEFFQDFVLDEKPEKLSGSGYTLKNLKENIEEKLFGGETGEPPAGELQLTHSELAEKILALVGTDGDTDGDGAAPRTGSDSHHSTVVHTRAPAPLLHHNTDRCSAPVSAPTMLRSSLRPHHNTEGAETGAEQRSITTRSPQHRVSAPITTP